MNEVHDDDKQRRERNSSLDDEKDFHSPFCQLPTLQKQEE